jgi:hypothetical protein
MSVFSTDWGPTDTCRVLTETPSLEDHRRVCCFSAHLLPRGWGVLLSPGGLAALLTDSRHDPHVIQLFVHITHSLRACESSSVPGPSALIYSDSCPYTAKCGIQKAIFKLRNVGSRLCGCALEAGWSRHVALSALTLCVAENFVARQSLIDPSLWGKEKAHYLCQEYALIFPINKILVGFDRRHIDAIRNIFIAAVPATKG